MSEKTILQLHREKIIPPSSGGKKRVLKTAEALTDFGELYLATPDSEIKNNSINHIKLNEKIFNKFISINTWNFCNIMMEANPIHHMLAREVKDKIPNYVNPDIVISESPQTMLIARDIAMEFNSKFVLNKHNCAYDLLRQILKEKIFSNNLANIVSQSLKKLESRAISEADLVTFQSENDANKYNVDKSKTIVIPNGTEFTNMSKSEKNLELLNEIGARKNRLKCAYVGSFDYTPNRDAAIYIIEKLSKKFPGVDFLLIGKSAPKAGIENVHTTGFVEDLGGVLKACDIAICPLARGSGTKLKMLDYMAAKLPIVTTKVGCEGLPLVHNQDALISEDRSSFPAQLSRLIEAESLRNSLAEASFKIGKEYDWENLMSEYIDELRGL